MTQAPTCPTCGRPMILRTARRGPRAGGQFFGCSGYPSCKTVVPLETAEGELGAGPNGQIAEAKEQSERIVPRTFFPREIRAAPIRPGLQTRFFQAMGLPASVLFRLYDLAIDREVITGASQWRLDSPDPRIIDTSASTYLAVAESMLTRGAATLCSPVLDPLLQKLFPTEIAAEDLTSSLTAVATVPTLTGAVPHLDSPEEGQFLDMLADWGLPWCAVPQVHLSSLVPDTQSAQQSRIDFVLSAPGEQPIAVEIDGAQHEGHGDRDADRDRALNSGGLRTLRIPVAEIRNRQGHSVDLLKIELEKPSLDQRPDTKTEEGLRTSKLAHQLQICLLEAIRGGWLSGPTCKVGVVLPPKRGSRAVRRILQVAASELISLLSAVARVHSTSATLPNDVELVFDPSRFLDEHVDAVVRGAIPSEREADLGIANIPVFLINDVCLPCECSAPPTSATPVAIPQSCRRRCHLVPQVPVQEARVLGRSMGRRPPKPPGQGFRGAPSNGRRKVHRLSACCSSPPWHVHRC